MMKKQNYSILLVFSLVIIFSLIFPYYFPFFIHWENTDQM